MNVINFNSEQCLRVRRQLDAYLSNELLVETTAEILRHLETCADCALELETRTRVRDALRHAVGGQEVPEHLRESIRQELEAQSAGNPWSFGRVAWAAALALVLIATLFGAKYWSNLRSGRQLVASILRIGVADHIQCAIRGHNYPEIANPPDKLRENLGPQYSPLLAIVQQKLPGFEVLEAHVCSIPDSPRKYVHFITRGRGTILSVILTRADGAHLPNGQAVKSIDSGGVSLYEAHLDGMNAAGFEAADYFGFVVSDLSRQEILEIARGLAPPLRDALEATQANAYRGIVGHWMRRNS